MRIFVSGCTATYLRLWPAYSDVLGVLRTPKGSFSHIAATGSPWAADNGAFAGLDENKFRRMLLQITGQTRAVFVAVPDVVGDHSATVASWLAWRDDVAESGHPLAFVGQDGASVPSVPWDEIGALFVGGSTAWKLSREASRLCDEAKYRGLWVHVGRVNSLRRMKIAYGMGADSIDGTGMTRWGDVHLEKFCKWARNPKE